MNAGHFTYLKMVCIALLLLTGACREDQRPRPRGYIRIDLPEKEYRLFDSVYPYAFKLPVYSRIEPDRHEQAEPYWANILFPSYSGTIHLSYKRVQTTSDLIQYFDDARKFVNHHIPKATAIREEVFMHAEHDVYGLIYQIMGKDAASPIQFYVTDSMQHFLRGALYFEVTPNNDSLAPVIRFIEEDIRKMLGSLRWKEIY